MPVNNFGGQMRKYENSSGSKTSGIAQNTYYELVHIYNKKLALVPVRQVNDEAAAKNCTIKVTIDGMTLTSDSTNMTNNVSYYLCISPANSTGLQVNSSVYTFSYTQSMIEARDIKIEMRTESAPGTNQKFYVYIFDNSD